MKHSLAETTLKNGIKILYIDVPGSKSFNLAIALNSGYRFATKDDIDKYEVPHVLEHLVFDGSEKYQTSDELQGVFSSGGGESNGFTTPYHNIFAFHNRVRNAEQVLRAGLDMVFHPRLGKKSFEEEYRVIENELQEGMGDISGNAMLYTMQQVLPDFPGSTDTQIARLPNVVYDDVEAYHKKYYGTANTTLMLCADLRELKKATIETIILEATAHATRGKAYAFPKFEVAAANPKSAAFVGVHKSMTDTVACAMLLCNGRKPRKDMLALGLFGALITGMKSYSVNYKLRKQGLVYGIEFGVSESLESCGFELDISANNRRFNEVYAHTLGAIRDLAEKGITDKQFESARQEYVESFEDNAESPDAIIGWYLQDYLMDGTLLAPADFAKMAATITQQEMLELAREVFAYENLYHTAFSSKAIRASSSMELLAQEVLKNRKPVTGELLMANAVPLGDEDARYGKSMILLLVAILLVFVAPLGFGVWSESLSGVYLRVIGMPWTIIAPIYFGILFFVPFVMNGRELRKTFLQMFIAFVAWMVIVATFDASEFVEVLTSSVSFIRIQAWSLIGILLVAFAATIYGVRQMIGEWLAGRTWYLFTKKAPAPELVAEGANKTDE